MIDREREPKWAKSTVFNGLAHNILLLPALQWIQFHTVGSPANSYSLFKRVYLKHLNLQELVGVAFLRRHTLEMRATLDLGAFPYSLNASGEEP